MAAVRWHWGAKVAEIGQGSGDCLADVPASLLHTGSTNGWLDFGRIGLKDQLACLCRANGGNLLEQYQDCSDFLGYGRICQLACLLRVHAYLMHGLRIASWMRTGLGWPDASSYPSEELWRKLYSASLLVIFKMPGHIYEFVDSYCAVAL